MRWNREAIVRQALALVNEIGLDALTVRRLADRLHVQNPALYRHFTSKQELLDSMAEMMLRTTFLASDATTTERAQDETGEAWDRRLVHLARAFRRMLLAQRDGARIIASANLPKGALLPGFERTLALLQDAGLSPATSWYAIKATFDYTLGAVFEEQAGPQDEEARVAAIERIHETQPLPTIMKTLTDLGRRGGQQQEDENGASFEAGLSMIIMGAQATHRS